MYQHPNQTDIFLSLLVFSFNFCFLSPFCSMPYERQLKLLLILWFVTCIKEELFNIQLMRMNY